MTSPRAGFLVAASLGSVVALLIAAACGSDDPEVTAGPGEGNGADGAAPSDGKGGGADAAPDTNTYSCVDGGVVMSGETCKDAIDVSCGGTFAGSTVGKVDDYQTCNTGGLGGDVAYVIHAPVSQRFVTRAEPRVPTYRMAVHVKRDCGKMFECLSESAIPVLGGVPGTVLNDFEVAAGETVYVIVDGTTEPPPATATGDYTLTVTRQAPAGTTCANAIDVSSGGSYGSTTGGAGDDYNGNGCTVQKAGEDRVYSIMTPASRTFDLRLDTRSGSGEADLALYVRTDCGSQTCVPESKDGTLGSNTRILLTTAPGVRYFIFVDGMMKSGVSYILHVDTKATFGKPPAQGSVTRG